MNVDIKTEIKQEFYKRFFLNQPVTELEVYNTDKDFFGKILNTFGSWAKFERETGFLQRHLREREKFFLYMKMKMRSQDVKRFGPNPAVEGLRHKSIEPEVKDRISECFGTIIALTNYIVDDWNEDRVVFEAHSHFITGASPEDLPKKDPIMYGKLIEIFAPKKDKENVAKAEENFYAEYLKRFMINPLEMISAQKSLQEGMAEIKEKEKLPTVGDVGIDLKTLIAIGYIKQEDAEQILASSKVGKEEVLDYVNSLDENITDSQLASQDTAKWLAVKNKFGSLKKARAVLKQVKDLQKQA
ncbi:hypothetical protein [Priestia aryabhattai]